MSSAARQRRYLERQKSDVAVFPIVANKELLAEMLERAEFLPRYETHSRADLQKALQRVVDVWLGSSDASIDNP